MGFKKRYFFITILVLVAIYVMWGYDYGPPPTPKLCLLKGGLNSFDCPDYDLSFDGRTGGAMLAIMPPSGQSYSLVTLAVMGQSPELKGDKWFDDPRIFCEYLGSPTPLENFESTQGEGNFFKLDCSRGPILIEDVGEEYTFDIILVYREGNDSQSHIVTGELGPISIGRGSPQVSS